MRYQGWRYDIRDIDEDLYLAVLASRRAQDGRAATGLSNEPSTPEVTARDNKGQEMQ